MLIQVRERGYTPYRVEVESLEEVEGFNFDQSLHADPKVFGLIDTYEGRNTTCLHDQDAEIAIVILR